MNRTARVFAMAVLAFVALGACTAPPDGGPASTTTTTTPVLPSAGCYDSAGGNADLVYDGQIDTYRNLTHYNSTDGTCTGGLYAGGNFPRSWVHATSQGQAQTKCAGLGQTAQNAPTNTVYTAAPDDIWMCIG